MTIDDQLDAQERDVAELESLAAELVAAISELDEIESELNALAEIS